MVKKQQVNNRDAGLAAVNATNKIAAELVGKIYKAFCNDNTALMDDVKNYLVNNTKAVLLVTNHKCPYILHSVCYLMLGQGCADILKQMSIENVRVLKECISVATGRGRPDEASLVKMLQSSDDEIMLQSGTIAKNVSMFWDDVNAELLAWATEIDEFQRITSNGQWMNTKEVAIRFGLAPNSTFYKNMEKVAEAHPEINDKDSGIRNNDGQENLYNPKHLWRIKQWLDEVCAITVPEGWWQSDELAEKLGVSKKEFTLRKCELKKRLEKEDPESALKMQSWFMLKNRVLWFNPEHFEEMKQLFNKPKQKAAKALDKVVEKPAKKRGATKKVKKTAQKSVAAPAKKKVKRSAQKTADANTVQKIVGADAHPTDMLGVKALEAKVAALTKMLKEAEARCDEILVKLSNAKPVERPELLHQMEQANNEVMAAEKDLDTANALQNEKLAKLDAVRAAEEAKRVAEEAVRAAEEAKRAADAALADVDTRVAEFLKQHQK